MYIDRPTPSYRKLALFLLPLCGAVALVLLLAYKWFQADYSLQGLVSLLRTYTKSFVLDWAVITALLSAAALLLLMIAKWQQRAAASVSIYVLLVLLSLLLTIFLTLTQYNFHLAETLLWLKSHPYHFAVSAAFVLSIVFFIFALLGNYYVAAIVTAFLLGTVGFAHYMKLKVLGEPLYPTDFKQIKQVQELMPMVLNAVSIPKLLLALVLIGALAYAWKWLPKHRLYMWHRLILLAVSGMLVWSYYNFQNSFVSTITKKVNIGFFPWDQPATYQANGFILGLVSNFRQDVMKKPAGYSKEAVLQAAERIAAETKTQPQTADIPKQPNVIYIMSEAFWDPTVLKNVSLSGDPLPYLHSLEETSIHGHTLSPAWGGATANVEFEALTGFSMSLMLAGSTPYQQVVEEQSSIPTIVSTLESDGYETYALHPFNKYFYKRNRVYDTFGFNHFISQDDIRYKDVAGTYISDMSVSKELIDLLKASKKPTFIHTVTMQNHFPYPPGRFPEEQVKVQSGLNAEHTGILQSYMEGIRLSDEALRYLTSELEKLNEPTLLVLWGDHQPALGTSGSLYQEAKYVTNWKTSQDIKNSRQTPLVFYANFPLPNTDVGTISPIYLNGYVLDLLGDKVPPYYRFLQQLQQEMPGLLNNLKLGSNQEPIKRLTAKQKELLKTYKLLQYDLLVGKQYGKDILFQTN